MDRRRFIQATAAGVAGYSLIGCSGTKPSSLGTAQPTNKRLYIDGLSFIPEDDKEHIDVKAAELDCFIADVSMWEGVKLPDGSMSYKRTYTACMNNIKQVHKTLTQYQDTYLLGTKGSDIALAKAKDKCAVFMQIQGADCVEESLDQVDEFYDVGLRALQLTHHYNNLYAGGALSKGDQGLTDKGFALIDKLESKNMLIDLSHSTVASAEDTLKQAKGPVVQTHGAARAIVNNARCTPDHVIKAIADSGGVFGVFMMSWWLTGEKVPRPEHYIEQLKHIKNLAGIDAVAIANDYPIRGQKAALASGNNNEVAIEGYRSWWQSVGEHGILGFDKDVHHVVIPELNHIKRMRSIEHYLQKARFTDDEIDKIMGGNWQRVLTDVLG